MPEPRQQGDLRRDLEAAVGPGAVVVDRDRLLGYETDWTGKWHGEALFAVRPTSAEEVVAVIEACTRARTGLVVQGGNTGLAGGATPFDGEVVLDTRALTEIGEVDQRAGQVTVGAGVTLQEVQEAARREGFDFGVDFAARGQATAGGMVATNAGGAKALRYGTMRQNVAGLEAVLADGRLVNRLSGLPKDNAGYDLPSLLVGSEGTLAVVTKVRLSLIAKTQRHVTGLLGVESLEEAVDLVASLRESLGGALEAAECFDRLGLEMVCDHLGLGDPLDRPSPSYALLEVVDAEDPVSLLAAALPDRYLESLVAADDLARRTALWAYRESLNEAAAAVGVAQKYDVSIPLAVLPEFATAVRAEVEGEREELRVSIYGHLGDGNLHINLLGRGRETSDLDTRVASVVALFGGTVSAEHGIGLAKRLILEATRSREEVEVMEDIKRAIDPVGILGAGRVLPPRREP